MNTLATSKIESEIILSRPDQVLRSNGQSFYFASRIFPQNQMNRVSVLYSICRYIDDCADEHDVNFAREKLKRLRSVLNGLTANTSIATQNESELWFEQKVQQVKSWGVKEQNISDLLKGAEDDLDRTLIPDEAQLLEYCYLVAGVVGLMMCPLIGVEKREAHPAAVNLGIAMQLTNICRDVDEDNKNGRIYLPELGSVSLLSNQPVKVSETVRKYLDMADRYYEKGYQGLSYIPFRARLVILIAGEVYRHIGVKIRKNNYDVLSGRTYLNLLEKALVALKALRFLTKSWFWRRQEMVARP